MTAMLDHTATPGSRTNPVLDRVRPLLPQIADAADEGERDRAVPARIVTALREAGVFRMTLPVAWGGCGLGLPEAAEVITAIARADGSAGWTAQVGSMIATFLRSLPRETLENEVYGAGADLMFRGAVAPKGKATPVEGGFRISGRWPLASGPYTPDWMLAGFVVDGQPPVRPDGFPDLRVALFRPSDVTFLDTWDAVGLRATQSNDFVMDDVFVPERHTGSLFVGNNIPGPLYDLPYSPTGSSHDAVVIGLLRGALDDLAGLAATKRPAFNPRVVLGEDPVFQTTFGELELRVSALAALHRETTDTVMERALAGEQPTPLEWTLHTAATQHVHHEGVRVMTEIMTLSGTAAIYNSGPLPRRWRDLRCVAQHVAANSGHVRRLGAMLSGQPAS